MQPVYWFQSKRLLDYTNLFSPNDYKKNDKIILKHFQSLRRWKNYIGLFAVGIENLKNVKYQTSLKNIKNSNSFYYFQ